MREIKFRVWDVLNKRMLDWGDIFDLPAWEIFPGTPEQRAFEVMQYTGVKDKNGKEIYEGDVVECVSCKEKDRKYKVTWCDKFLGFVLEHKKEKYQISIFNDFKVIGNIYENPELLKEENND